MPVHAGPMSDATLLSEPEPPKASVEPADGVREFGCSDFAHFSHVVLTFLACVSRFPPQSVLTFLAFFAHQGGSVAAVRHGHER